MSAPGKPGSVTGKRDTAGDKKAATQPAAGHEGQVHHRNRTASLPGEDPYAGVPPGEEGQYGMRRDDASEPWYNDQTLTSHSADERDSHYAQWREQHPDGAGTVEDFEAWRRAQTAPGTNNGPRDAVEESTKKE
jgi:hypothetical protein